MEARPLKLRLFLEGREVPIVSAVCSASLNGLSTAALQVVATDALLDLLPRTLVHLFFYDSEEKASSLDDLKTDVHSTKELRLVKEWETYVADEKYKLLFVGEVYSIQYSQSHGDRSAVLQCRDLSSYQQEAKVLFVRGKSTSSKTKGTAFSAGAVIRYDKAARKPYEVILDLLTKKKSVKHPDTQGLMGGLLLLLEYMGGVYDGKSKFRGLNDFFSQAELRLHLSRLTGTVRNDNASQQLIGTKGFRKWLRRSLSSAGNLVSFQEILNMVLRQLQASRSPILAPNYRRKKTEEYEVTTRSSGLPLSDQAKLRLGELDWLKAKLAVANALFDKEYDGMPSAAAADVLFGETGPAPSGVKQTKQKDALLSFVGTHVDLGPSLELFCGKADPSFAAAPKAVLGQAELSDSLKADGQFSVAVKQDQAVLQQAKKMVTSKQPGESGGWYYSKCTLGNLNYLINLVNGARKAYKKSKVAGSTKTETFEGSSEPWLYTQVLTPEMFLVAPPRCNVLFPENLQQVSLSREWWKEVTRVHLTTRKEWKAQGKTFAKQQYFAPSSVDAYGESSKKQFAKGESFILPHELFSGVIPRYDQVADIPAYKKLSAYNAKEHKDAADFDRIDYLQRIANFLFLKYRLGPRVMSASGKFNPNVVTGMSALVLPSVPGDFQMFSDAALKKLKEDKEKLDKELESALTGGSIQALLDSTEKKLKDWQEKRDSYPKMYCGCMHSVVHSIGQDGGQTQYTISHLWDPLKEEVPGLNSFEIQVPKGTTTKTTTFDKYPVHGTTLTLDKIPPENVTTYYPESEATTLADGVPASYSGPAVTQVGAPADGDFDSMVSNSTKDAAAFLTGGPIKQLIKADQKKDNFKGPKGGVVTDVKFTNVGSKNGLFNVIPLGDGNARVGPGTYGTVTITEKVTEYDTKVISDVPFEYAVRPPWLGLNYSNTQVGETLYGPLFGCKSICDFSKISVTDRQTLISSLRELAPGEKSIDVSSEDLVAFTVDFATGGTIQDATLTILRLYLHHKIMETTWHISEYVDTFTRRGFASLNDLMGSRDLRYNPKGEVIGGREGFHSRAFGPHNQFFLLDHPALLSYGGTGEAKKLDPRIDPRRPRRLLVNRYLEQLEFYSTAATQYKTAGLDGSRMTDEG